MCSNANAAAGSAPVNPSDITLQNLANRGSLVSSASSAASKPATTTSITGLFDRSGSGGVGGVGVGGGGGGGVGGGGSNNSTAAAANKDTTVLQRVRIMDPSQTYETVNLGRRIDVQWPREDWKENGGKSGWNGWVPTKGMEGTILHRWVPCHRDPLHRSHVDRTILLVQIGTDKYVPIADAGVLHLGAEV